MYTLYFALTHKHTPSRGEKLLSAKRYNRQKGYIRYLNIMTILLYHSLSTCLDNSIIPFNDSVDPIIHYFLRECYSSMPLSSVPSSLSSLSLWMRRPFRPMPSSKCLCAVLASDHPNKMMMNIRMFKKLWTYRNSTNVSITLSHMFFLS